MRSRLIRTLFILVMIAGCTQAFTQSGNLSGRIVDSLTNQAVEYATISLVDKLNFKPITGTVSGKSGDFSLSDIRPGNYRILIEAIGFLKFSQDILISINNKGADLGKIALHQNSSRLQTITVTGGQKLIENKIDKMVFNAEKDLTSQGGVATDILKKIPQISVDVDGNVELAGSSSIRFLIDGKPSTAFVNNITDVLQSIPASQIKSIEVITSPGAKYDAEGLGGIINIILKHNSLRGTNGSVSLTAASRNENGSINLSFRQGNFGINVFANGNARLPASTPLTSTRISTDTANNTQFILAQDGSTRFYRYGIESGLSIDYSLNKKNSFSFSVSDNHFGATYKGSQNQTQTTVDSHGISLNTVLSSSVTQSEFSIHSFNYSVDYKRTFEKEDQELDFGVHTSTDRNNFNSINTQYAQSANAAYYGTSNNNPGTEGETEIVLDYTEPISRRVVLGIGGKMVFTDIHSSSDVLSLQPSGVYTYDSTLSNYLLYKQQVYATYAELGFPVSNWFDVKVGLRYERTNLNTFFSDIHQQVNEPGYNTFVPSIFLSRKINDKQTVKLSYSKRIERPDYRFLNPFINTTDPYNITTGNPYLQPEIGHQFELGWSYDLESKGSLMISAFYRLNQDDIQPYVVYYTSLPVGDTVYKNVSVSTRQNIGTEKNLGLNLFSDLHFNSKFSVRTNIFLFYRQGFNVLDSNIKTESFNYKINMNLSYNFSPKLAGEFFANFNSPRNEIQGKYPSFSSYTFAFRQQIWKKKGSVALTATNIFSEYLNQPTEIFGSNFTVNSNRKIPFRSVGINFTWKFGKLDFKKSKSENSDGPVPIE